MMKSEKGKVLSGKGIYLGYFFNGCIMHACMHGINMASALGHTGRSALLGG